MTKEATLDVAPAVNFPSRKMVAERLDSDNPEHLKRTAEIIKSGGIVAFPFNGVFGLFGDMDIPSVTGSILGAKSRTNDKLIIVNTPEEIEGHACIGHLSHLKQNLVDFWKEIHALGIIFPASTAAPRHLVFGEGLDHTIMTIWTEYSPLRVMIEHFQHLGGRGLVGTSANKSGEPTHFEYKYLAKDFVTEVQALVAGNFDHLPPFRRRSTSIIDYTDHVPRLHREGNVTEEEIRDMLGKHGLPDLTVGRDVITVRPRLYSP